MGSPRGTGLFLDMGSHSHEIQNEKQASTLTMWRSTLPTHPIEARTHLRTKLWSHTSRSTAVFCMLLQEPPPALFFYHKWFGDKKYYLILCPGCFWWYQTQRGLGASAPKPRSSLFPFTQMSWLCYLYSVFSVIPGCCRGR